MKENSIIMKQFNNYEAPEIVIMELEEKDLITTSIGDSGIVEIDW